MITTTFIHADINHRCTYDKELAIFVPSPKASLWDSLDVELGMQLRDTFDNNLRLIESVATWHWATGKTSSDWVLRISIRTTYQRMPSKVRAALENDIKDTLKELSSGVLIMKSSRMIIKIN